MADWKNDIEKYLRGELSREEMHALEKKALNDPFLADALEGAESVGASTFVEDVTLLQQRFAGKRHIGNLWMMPLRIAASIALVLVASYLVYTYIVPENNEHLALESPKQDAPTAPQTIVEGDSDAREKSAAEENASTPGSGPVEKSKKDVAKSPAITQPAAEQLQGVTPGIDVATTQAGPSEDDAAAKKGEAEPEVVAPLARDDKSTETVTKEAYGLAGAKRAKAQDKKMDIADNNPSPLISGKITSADDGAPIPGANVIVGGTGIGAVSNKDGEYQLLGGSREDTLVVSSLGYLSKQVMVPAGGAALNVALPVESVALNEVVVTALDDPDGPLEPNVVELAFPEVGKPAYNLYLEKNLRYPARALAQKTEGKVTVEFSVDTDGAFSDFTVIKGIGNGCDEEVVRLVKEGPSWRPSMRSGVPVKSKARVRVRFKVPK